ncbi:TIR domain-containing protein, partial [Mycolicibacterium parafortuitum]
TVTAVLIGAETSNRRWVNYEIRESLARGNGLLGIYIHNILDFNRRPDRMGVNPLPSTVPTYDWVRDNGYQNLGAWVDRAYASR